MRFLYATDLHGDMSKYNDVINFALEQHISLIHLGADILPKGTGMLKKQKIFINNFLKQFYARCAENDITVLASFGNDDLYTRKKYFKKYATLLEENLYKEEEYEFKAYSFVTDHCFGLKNGVKLDKKDLMPTKLRSKKDLLLSLLLCKDVYSVSEEIDVNEKGFYFIKNIKKYFEKKGTIEEDLKKIKISDKTIMSIHCPPASLNLDVTNTGERVGSKSVLEWIKKEQPLLVLSGHIHESFSITKIWKAEICKTTVIQPGNEHFVYIEINNEEKIISNLIPFLEKNL